MEHRQTTERHNEGGGGAEGGYSAHDVGRKRTVRSPSPASSAPSTEGSRRRGRGERRRGRSRSRDDSRRRSSYSPRREASRRHRRRSEGSRSSHDDDEYYYEEQQGRHHRHHHHHRQAAERRARDEPHSDHHHHHHHHNHQSLINASQLFANINNTMSLTEEPDLTGMLARGQHQIVKVPCDLPIVLTSFLDLVASFVAVGGPAVEEEVKIREENNPYFAFLRAPWRDPSQVYYRWRLYSLLQGDSLSSWRTEPFVMEDGSHALVWVPPPMVVARRLGGAGREEGEKKEGDVDTNTLLSPLPLAEIEAIHYEKPMVSVLSSCKATADDDGDHAPISHGGDHRLRKGLCMPSIVSSVFEDAQKAAAGERSQVEVNAAKAAEERRKKGEEGDETKDPQQKSAAPAPSSTSSLFDDAFFSIDDLLGGGGGGGNAKAAPTPSGVNAEEANATAKPQQDQHQLQNDDDDEKQLLVSDDLLGISRHEARVLANAFFPRQSTHPEKRETANIGGGEEEVYAQRFPFIIPYLPTPDKDVSSAAPYFLQHAADGIVLENNPCVFASTSALRPAGVSGGCSNGGNDAFIRSSFYLSKALATREKAFFAFLSSRDAAAFEGFSEPTEDPAKQIPPQSTADRVAAAAASQSQHALNNTTFKSLSTPLTSHVTCSINLIGRVKAAACLYAYRRAKHYAFHSSSTTSPPDSNTNSTANAGNGCEGVGLGGRYKVFRRMCDGSALTEFFKTLLFAPSSENSGERLATLQNVLRQRIAARFPSLSMSGEEAVEGECSSSASSSAALTIVEMLRYVATAYSCLFVTDELPNTTATSTSTSSSTDAANTERFHRTLLQRALLDKAFVDDTTLFFVHRHRAAHHSLSLLVDEANRVAKSLPVEIIAFAQFMASADVLLSAEAREAVEILSHQRHSGGCGDNSTAASTLPQRYASAITFFSQLPSRIVNLHTYCLQSILFILNNVMCVLAPPLPSVSASGTEGAATAGSDAPLMIDLADVAATSASLSGSAFADQLAAMPPLPTSLAGESTISGASPSPSSLAVVAQHLASQQALLHYARVNSIILSTANAKPRLLHAAEMTLPCFIEVMVEYVGTVEAMFGRGNAQPSNSNVPAAAAAAAGGGTLVVEGSLDLQDGGLAAVSSPSACVFLAAQLTGWLRTLLFEWFHTRKVLAGRRYQMLMSRYPFLSQ